jgi:phage regulatory protein, rha family
MSNFVVKVENINGILVTTSNRVAEELGVNHKDLLEKIDGYIEKFNSAELSAQFYIPHNYKDRSGKTNRNYLITKKGVAQLVGGYSAAVPRAFELNVDYINEFERMENYIKGEFQLPKTFAEALRLAADQQEQLETLKLENKIKEQQIMELQPKALYYDLILQCKELLSVTAIAKDYGKSAQEFNKILHDLGVQYKQSGVWFLYQKYAIYGYTQTKANPYTKTDGTLDSKTHMYWTQKGRIFLYNLLKENGILPNIEKEENEVA